MSKKAIRHNAAVKAWKTRRANEKAAEAKRVARRSKSATRFHPGTPRHVRAAHLAKAKLTKQPVGAQA